jgi:hypothetical protein
MTMKLAHGSASTCAASRSRSTTRAAQGAGSEREAIAGLLDDVLDELHLSRQMRQATGRDRTDSAKDRSGKFRFRLKASNGQVVATGEAYEPRLPRRRAASPCCGPRPARRSRKSSRRTNAAGLLRDRLSEAQAYD